MLATRPVTRVDPKRRAVLDPKKRQFAKAQWKEQEYTSRMNFYTIPPTGDIALEQFEEWGIARLKVLAELESCSYRSRTPEETAQYMGPILAKHMPLLSNTSRSSTLNLERKRDHYSHWTLRLAFSATEELRKRFTRLEAQLFRLRLQQDDARERRDFIESLGMNWSTVSDEEKRELGENLRKATGWRKEEEEAWFKVPFELVTELVESRRCYLRAGTAYVHVREQLGMVVSEFSRRLEAGLELAARALPRMDEDNRLAPILNHLSKSFTTPDAAYSADGGSISDTTAITARSIDELVRFFPLCMQNLHRELRKNSHLKHYGRLQYTLFLKGIGMDMNECIAFWRMSFKLITDDKFKKEYTYNIRHAYGDVGGDANRRGRGYSPYNCQKLLTEALPGPGQSHGCPYRTFTPDNLVSLLQASGISDQSLLKSIREDVSKQRYHIACNRVFEQRNKEQIKKVKEQNLWPASELDTILHPNTYFKRGFLLANLGLVKSGDVGVDGASQ
ncbi:DNA primase [Myriangium duriaei CBS 260.36]|uniref:DNA primase large subunit n=1 Tax=Myriangium duriaei CBS 260.36 TaxID=1168546 RepID=A0A9P4J6P8_9PEZI|nr:DNA primase [Myriangium duriaei CBS 260.36]